MALVHRINSICSVEDSTTVTSPGIGGPRVENKAQRVMINGTGAGQADLVYDNTHTISAAGTLTLDLATGGGLTQQDGSAIAMVKLKGLIVRKTAGSGSFTVEIPANGILHMAAAGDKTATFATNDDYYSFSSYVGVTVTAATADEILINEEGGASTVTVHVTAWGDSA